MRLAAIYLPSNTLPYIFGNDHDEITLNLGGEYLYKIFLNEKALEVNREVKNHNFINGFWGEDIELVTAIVGKNGAGKTTILRAINNLSDSKKKKVLYLFENAKNEMVFFNEIEGKEIESQHKYSVLQSNAFDGFKLYYSPVIDLKSINTNSPLNLAKKEDNTLKELYFNQMLQDIRLLNDPLLPVIKDVYPDFPSFNSVEITVSNHTKYDFKNIYASSNLGNEDRTRVLKNYIDSDFTDLKEGKWDNFLTKSFIEDRFNHYLSIIESKGLNSLFDRLWNLEEFSTPQENDNLHSASNFLKDFEITLFSYLILDATFPITPFQRSFEFQDILDKKNFKDRLNGFMEFYFANIYGVVKDGILEKYGEVNIDNYENLKNLIDEDSNKKMTVRRFKSEDAVKLMLVYLDRFKAIYDFYDLLIGFIETNKLTLLEGKLIYNRLENKEEDFQDFINGYLSMLDNLSHLVMNVDLLSFSSEIDLSSGEKSLLNFYSRLNSYVENFKIREHQSNEFYLLMLDEPELGYHPQWKKKFVDALTKILPIIFSKIEPKQPFTGKTSKVAIRKSPKLQVIFTTHDPLSLSDMPNANVIYIDVDKETKLSKIIQNSDEIINSFGANVHELLAHGFFLEKGHIGEFARNKINSVIKVLNELIELKKSGKQIQINKLRKQEIFKTINLVGDRVIRGKLMEMYFDLFSDQLAVDEEIQNLEERIALLKNKRNDRNKGMLQ